MFIRLFISLFIVLSFQSTYANTNKDYNRFLIQHVNKFQIIVFDRLNEKMKLCVFKNMQSKEIECGSWEKLND